MIRRKLVIWGTLAFCISQGIGDAATPSAPPKLCIGDTSTCAEVSDSSGIKWHPGHYVLSPTVDSYSASQIKGLADEPNVLGWEQLISWSTIEPSKGNYDWTFIDALLALCQANGKRLVLQVMDRSFSGTNAGRLPGYLASEPGGGGGYFVKPKGVIAKLWLKPIMDRELALFKAIGQRYDGNPNFEGIFTGESDPGFTDGPSDYTAQAYMAQLYREIQTLADYFPHTNVWLSVNFVPTGQTAVVDLLAQIRKSRIGLAGPDVIGGSGDHSDWAIRTLQGLRYSNSVWAAGGSDQRGQIAVAHDVEDPELGGRAGGFTMDEIYDHSYNVNQDSHLFWTLKNYKVSTGSNKDIMWSSDILPYISGGRRPTRIACPAFYTMGCNTN